MKRNLIASIDVDPQKTFTPLCPNELPIIDGHTIVHALNQQAAKAHFRVLTKDAHPTNAVWQVTTHNQMGQPLTFPNADRTWVAHAQVGSNGFNTLDGLPDVTKYDFVVWKGIEKDLHPYGACFHDLEEKLSTGLIEWLNANKVTCIILGGLATDHCVKTTAIQLKKRGQFDVWVNLESCRGIAEDTIQQAICDMQSYKIHVIPTLQDFVYSS